MSEYPEIRKIIREGLRKRRVTRDGNIYYITTGKKLDGDTVLKKITEIQKKDSDSFKKIEEIRELIYEYISTYTVEELLRVKIYF
jgi:hypothetical protein